MLYFIAGVLSPQPEAVSEVVMPAFYFSSMAFFGGGGGGRRRYNLVFFRETGSRTVRSGSTCFWCSGEWNNYLC